MSPADKPDQSAQEQQLPQSGEKQALKVKVGAVDLAAGERIAGKGDVFGESGLFPEELGPFRLESAKTLSFVSAFVLTAASLREIEAEYHAVRHLSRTTRSPLLCFSCRL